MKFKIIHIIPCIAIVISIYVHLNLASLRRIDKVRYTNSSRYAFATVTTPAFCMGAVVLGYTLRKYNGNDYSYLCLVTKDVNSKWRRILSQWWRVEQVNDAKPYLWFRRSWIKLELWTFTEYEKIVYLDTDTLPTQRIDELFNHSELSCVSDPMPPQICNTGLLVLEPNLTTFKHMKKLSKDLYANNPPGDQGFINFFFGQFNPLPTLYNVPRLFDTNFEFLYEQKLIKVVHFVCKKPWKCGREGVETCGCGMYSLNQVWWDIWDEACKGHECWEFWGE
ncbi:Glycosyl transferase family 8 protein [Trichomonas vaginalis G3]|uniref:Glycosyl transferase family 8 protein n=1 Tax=Trichomonas vaginalis (strain ATCC PRA-98 / G3) TaxID=412133 RepID=A2FG67_TRIV3|nr:glycosyl transferase [Trichomonas vaginalis G3]EAX96106.1 Glycosyl transferase family 8 protein [Trichomonas vaginalis G3]KAI5500078.1 glycogenin glucosyltransferase protein [Trichomonas vaginalis G3]|eukprot:XP_001309036.1 glycosyl transferase [Trichomonas vaginalis G3]